MRPDDVLKLYETKIKLQRFDELAPLIANDAVFWFSDGSHCGLKEIRAAFERTWEKSQEEVYWLEDLRWIAVGDDAASCIYTFHWKGLWDGKAFEGKGRGTTVLQKRSGEWKITHEHLSHFPR
ncbi:nuclear transport factor 2 family protein [Rhizobium rhizogenes]|uniref:YybH family protein n=1 Tax=Rhizobium rhizogenes TaxID=359 RepID=UPI0006484463|nr:nuclear transport factor 2 family protein [Rhizobium rhizogenes]